MREVVLDTETTGLSPEEGHRIVEIGCVELVNHVPTGSCCQWYINPERDMPSEAQAIHGLSTEFLLSKPLFSQIAGSLLEFIDNAKLVIHNAAFDIGFINSELYRCNFGSLPMDRVIDTITLAHRLFPGLPVSLDALCRRFSIENSNRKKHSAILDAKLLASVYLELIGGREPELSLVTAVTKVMDSHLITNASPYRAARSYVVPLEELEAHNMLVTKLKDPIWNL